MAQLTDTLLQQMVDAIVVEVDPEQVILFGSRAKGDAHEDSDVDLVVLESEPFEDGRSRHAEEVRLYSALSNFRVPKTSSSTVTRKRSIGRIPSTTS